MVQKVFRSYVINFFQKNPHSSLGASHSNMVASPKTSLITGQVRAHSLFTAWVSSREFFKIQKRWQEYLANTKKAALRDPGVDTFAN